MARILRIELRRSVAPWTALLIAAIGAFLLFALQPQYPAWMELVYNQRDMMRLTWPLALGAGAWQGIRERRSRVDELFTTTPRPRRQRVLPVAAAMAVAAVAADLVMVASGAGHLRNPDGYFPPHAVPIIAIGALGMVAAVWLGLAIGSLLPTLLTPPMLTVIGFISLVLPDVLVTSDRQPGALLLLPNLPGPGITRVVNGPAQPLPYAFETVSAAANLSQAVWLTAVAAVGLALFAAARSATRVAAALLPVLLGAAIAVSMLPDTVRAAWVDDRHATETICTRDEPRVCTARVYSYAVDHLRGPAREALATLAAKLPAAPTRVLVKDDSEGRPTVTQPADTLLVFVSLYYDDATRYKPGYLVDRMLDGGGVPPCGSPSGSPDTRHQAARLVAGAWLQDQDLPPADSTGKDPVLAPAREALAALRALPADEQRARVAALRDAERTCAEGDRLALLTGSRP